MKTILKTFFFLVLANTYVKAQEFNINITQHPREYQKIIGQYEYNRASSQKRGYAASTTKGEFEGKSIKIYFHENSKKSKLAVTGSVTYTAEYDSERQEVSVYHGNDEIGKAKLKGYKLTPAISFSMNGRQLVALSGNSDKHVIYAYIFDLASQKWTVNGKAFKSSDKHVVYAFGLVGSTGIDNQIFGKEMDGRTILILDVKTSKIATFDSEWPIYMYPSLTSNHLIFNGGNDLYDLERKEWVYSVPSKFVGKSHYSVFFPFGGNKIEDIQRKPIEGEGVGFVIVPKSIFIFDTNKNYMDFSHPTLKGKSVLEYVSFSDKMPLPHAEGPSSISLDYFDDSHKLEFLSTVAYQIEKEFTSKNNEGLNALIQVFDLAEPIDEVMMNMLVMWRITNEQSIYLGAMMTEYVNRASLSELMQDVVVGQDYTTDAKSANKKRREMLQYYSRATPKIESDPYSRFQINDIELARAIKKLLPLTKDDYYLPTDDLLQKGHNLVLSKPIESLIYYQLADNKEPNDPIIQNAIGHAYFQTGNYEKAVEYYNRSLAISPNNSLALSMILRTTWEPIRTAKEELSESKAKLIIASSNRVIAANSKEYKEHVEMAKQIHGLAQLFLEDKETYDNYNGATHFKQDTRAHAIYGLWPKIATAGDPYFAAYVAARLASDFKAIAEENEYRLEEYILADEMYAKAASVPEVISAKDYHGWARIRLDYLDQPDKALEAINIAKKAYPADSNFAELGAEISLRTGKRLYMSGAFKEALPYLKEYYNNAPESTSSISDMLGMCYYRNGDYANATKHLANYPKIEKENTVRAFYPNYNDVLAFAKNPSGTAPSAIDNRGKVDQMSKRYEEADDVFDAGSREEALKMKEEALNYAIEIDYHVGMGVAYNGVGVLYHKMNNLEKAIECYKKSIEYGAISQSSYINLARILLGQDISDGVKKILNDGKSKFPDSKDFDSLYDIYYSIHYLNLAIAYWKKEDYSSTKSNALKAIEYDRSYGKAYAIYGYVLYAESDEANSKKMIIRADQLDPSLKTRYTWFDDVLNYYK